MEIIIVFYCDINRQFHSHEYRIHRPSLDNYYYILLLIENKEFLDLRTWILQSVKAGVKKNMEKEFDHVD